MNLQFSDLRLTVDERRLLRKISAHGVEGVECVSSTNLDRLLNHKLVCWITGTRYGIEPTGIDYLAYYKATVRRTIWRVIGDVVPIVISLISLAKSFESEIRTALECLRLLP